MKKISTKYEYKEVCVELRDGLLFDRNNTCKVFTELEFLNYYGSIGYQFVKLEARPNGSIKYLFKIEINTYVTEFGPREIKG